MGGDLPGLGEAPWCPRASDLSRPAQIEALIKSENAWQAITTFCNINARKGREEELEDKAISGPQNTGKAFRPAGHLWVFEVR